MEENSILVIRGSEKGMRSILKIDPILDLKTKNPRIHLEYLLVFMDLIYKTNLQYKTNYCPISIKEIRKYDNHGEKYLKWLCRNGFIDIDHKFEKGKKSKGYRLLFENMVEYKVKSKCINKKLNRINSVLNLNILPEDNLLREIFKRTENISIKEKEVLEFIDLEMKDEKDEILYKLKVIREREFKRGGFWFKRSKNVGRLYSPFTSLNKEIRNNFLLINGENIKHLDIPCCHPFLLVKIIEKYKKDFEDEFVKYIDLFSCDKDFYNYILFYHKTLHPKQKAVTRERVKKSFSVWLANNKENNISHTFSILFPKIHNKILSLKKMFNLSVELQIQESKIIIDDICRKLIMDTKTNFFTVHDQIYFPASQYDIVHKIWQDTIFPNNLLKSDLFSDDSLDNRENDK